jgi:hypothetical protein
MKKIFAAREPHPAFGHPLQIGPSEAKVPIWRGPWLDAVRVREKNNEEQFLSTRDPVCAVFNGRGTGRRIVPRFKEERIVRIPAARNVGEWAQQAMPLLY